MDHDHLLLPLRDMADNLARIGAVVFDKRDKRVAAPLLLLRLSCSLLPSSTIFGSAPVLDLKRVLDRDGLPFAAAAAL